jgi:hypothetical protein
MTKFSFYKLSIKHFHGPTNWKSWKQALGSLCGSGRIWWEMKNCILSLALSGQVFWLPQFFYFLTLGGFPEQIGWGIFVRYVSKNQKFNNLSKTGSLVEIFHREPTKIINLVKKVVKNRRFWVIFSTKTRYCTLDSLARGTKVGFKIKYNCYILQIQVLKFFIWSWWGDIRVRSGSLVKNRNFHLFDKGWFLSSKWPFLIDFSLKWTLT